ncbi:hypothetical protein [Kitasatospora cineracea]|uniref:hypothetical protein n=1 Tax=Kitasatospora cineracea TaxID=88074 RepID=UPI00367522CF
MPATTTAPSVRLSELFAADNPKARAREVRRLLRLDDAATAHYAAGVAECATYAAWEAAGRPGDYGTWLGSLPEPFLLALVMLAADADAAESEAPALRTIAACSAALRAVAAQVGH